MRDGLLIGDPDDDGERRDHRGWDPELVLDVGLARQRSRQPDGARAQAECESTQHEVLTSEEQSGTASGAVASMTTRVPAPWKTS